MAPSGDAPGLPGQGVQDAQGEPKVGMAVSPPGLSQSRSLSRAVPPARG